MKLNLNDQIEMALDEVTNAREMDQATMTLDAYANEVYYYVSTTEYTATGMNDSKHHRFQGKTTVLNKIKEAILADRNAMRYVKG